jgi:hypothetical protein
MQEGHAEILLIGVGDCAHPLGPIARVLRDEHPNEVYFPGHYRFGESCFIYGEGRCEYLLLPGTLSARRRGVP